MQPTCLRYRSSQFVHRFTPYAHGIVSTRSKFTTELLSAAAQHHVSSTHSHVLHRSARRWHGFPLASLLEREQMTTEMDPVDAPSRVRAERSNQSQRVMMSGLIGTTIEYYEFFIYGLAASLVFGEIFFHAEDPLVGTLLSLATFGLPYVARPLGGVIFGHFGDRIGRKKV